MKNLKFSLMWHEACECNTSHQRMVLDSSAWSDCTNSQVMQNCMRRVPCDAIIQSIAKFFIAISMKDCSPTHAESTSTWSLFFLVSTTFYTSSFSVLFYELPLCFLSELCKSGLSTWSERKKQSSKSQLVRIIDWIRMIKKSASKRQRCLTSVSLTKSSTY